MSTDVNNLAAAKSQDYVQAIDGMRAIAIGLVVAFHVGVLRVSGGFIGVDVFLLISGYLITGNLARELEHTGRIDIENFYARRSRRLLPALTVVLVATLFAGAVLLVPVGQQQGLGLSAVAAAGFVANIFFWRSQTGYFAETADELPLLHLWTLSVEEQFYLAWPLVMIGVARAARRMNIRTPDAIVGMLVFINILSFVACWRLTATRATMIFYNMPFRAWEFGVGALLALVPAHLFSKKPYLAGVCVAVGIAAILFAAVTLDRNTIFPGVAAAVPVMGAALTLAGIRMNPICGPAQWLGTAPMTVAGKLSYAWYLWHWPLISITRAMRPGEVSILRDCVLVIVAFGLSALSYHFVEEPIRRNGVGLFAQRRGSVVAGVALMTVAAALGLSLWSFAQWRIDRDAVLQAASKALTAKAPTPAECTNFNYQFSSLAPVTSCLSGSNAGSPAAMIWGDSHAFHFVPAFQALADAGVVRILPRAAGACKPQVVRVDAGLAESVGMQAKNCVSFNAAVRRSLPEFMAAGGKTVVLAARWSTPSALQTGLGDWERDLSQLVSGLAAEGFNVVLFAETPPQLSPAPQCIARNGEAKCSRSREEVDAQRGEALDTLKRIAARHPGMKVWDPIDELCSRDACPAMRDGVVLYSDDNHLSVQGARSLASAIEKNALPQASVDARSECVRGVTDAK